MSILHVNIGINLNVNTVRNIEFYLNVNTACKNWILRTYATKYFPH